MAVDKSRVSTGPSSGMVARATRDAAWPKAASARSRPEARWKLDPHNAYRRDGKDFLMKFPVGSDFVRPEGPFGIEIV
jgi:hypothetical protein